MKKKKECRTAFGANAVIKWLIVDAEAVGFASFNREQIEEIEHTDQHTLNPVYPNYRFKSLRVPVEVVNAEGVYQQQDDKRRVLQGFSHG